jgi:predicted CXXCH cytochrome family protein
VLSRTRSGSIGLIILCASLIFVVGCDPVQRHKILTFFFDGVPPLGGEAEEEEVTTDPNAEQAPKRTEVVWFVHEPYNDCRQCHGSERGPSYSRRGDLRALVPGLCYKCHGDYTETTGFLHGPVAVGECLFCHDSHRSKNEFLLIKPIPEQCYLCHDSKRIESIADHSTEEYSKCNSCHDSHVSSEESLLKRDWPGKTD